MKNKKDEFILKSALAATAVFVSLALNAAWWPEPDRSAEIVSNGMDRAALEKALAKVEEENRNQPYTIVRARQLAVIFDNTRLAVATNDVFVDWWPDWSILASSASKRCAPIIAANANALGPAARGVAGTHWAYRSMIDTSHVCPDWESILQLGPKGLAERARARLTTAANEKERAFLVSVIEAYEAMQRLCVRWAAAADSRGAKECAATLRAIAEHPPKTLRQALQLMLVYDRCQEVEYEPVRTQGLFDRLYIKFYRDDIAAGRQTRASAKELVREVFNKFSRQAHPMNKSISFGGYDNDGNPVWNELTEIAFEVHYERNDVNPKLAFRYGKKTPREHLLKVARSLAAGRTSIVFFNEETAREMFLRRGKDEADIANALLVGCYEPAIQGREVIASMAAWVNLARAVESPFRSGLSADGFRIGPDCPLPENYVAFEREYIRQVRALIASALSATRTLEKNWTEINPSPLMSGSFRDAIERARDAYDGGCRYNQSGVMLSGFGTVVDSLAAVKWLIEDQKLVTMSELREIIVADWKGHEELRRRVRRAAPKWGNNDDRADAIAKRIYSVIAATVNSEPNGHGGTFQSGFWSINHDAIFGKHTGATPDGRKAGELISRNNMATTGCGYAGATALILSNAKLDQAEAADGHIVDLVLPQSFAAGNDGVERIAAMLEAFSATGGMCLHLNCFSAEMLRDAVKNPAKYADMQVRICGWNVRWGELSKSERERFLKTAEAQEN